MPPEDLPERSPRRRSSMSLVIGAVILLVVAGGGYLAWEALFADKTPAEEPAPIPQAPVDDRASYASTTMGISLRYPKSYTVNDAYANLSVNPKKPISGVQFTIPMEVATGTNLSSDSGISVEQLPRARNCTADIYIQADVKTHSQTENGILYSVATTSNAAAGNLYEEQVFALSGTHPCTAMRYFIHSTNIGNYDAGVVREFNRSALLATFDEIRRSVVFRQP